MPQPHSLKNYTRTAGYIDRLLKDAMPADLPVQAPIKYRLVINLKAAKAPDLSVSAPAPTSRANDNAQLCSTEQLPELDFDRF